MMEKQAENMSKMNRQAESKIIIIFHSILGESSQNTQTPTPDHNGSRNRFLATFFFYISLQQIFM